MWKVLRGGLALCVAVSVLALAVLAGERPRAFRAHEWKPYVDRVATAQRAPHASAADPPPFPFSFGYGLNPSYEPLPDASLRPRTDASPELTRRLFALHTLLALALTARAAWRLRALRAHTRSAEPTGGPYRAPGAAPVDRLAEAIATQRSSTRAALVGWALAMALPWFTGLGEAMVLRAEGVVVRATPTAIGWFHDVRQRQSGSTSSVESHGVRATARVDGRIVHLEARCSGTLAPYLERGTLEPGSIPFVVWRRFPAVHQIGEVPTASTVAAWVHLLFLASTALWWASERAARRARLEGEA